MNITYIISRWFFASLASSLHLVQKYTMLFLLHFV
jgi:hypothetical protein